MRNIADTVALLVGPLVLFAVTDAEPKVTRAQLLAAKRTGHKIGRLKQRVGQ